MKKQKRKHCRSCSWEVISKIGEKLFMIKCMRCGKVVIRTSEEKAMNYWDKINKRNG